MNCGKISPIIKLLFLSILITGCASDINNRKKSYYELDQRCANPDSSIAIFVETTLLYKGLIKEGSVDLQEHQRMEVETIAIVDWMEDDFYTSVYKMKIYSMNADPIDVLVVNGTNGDNCLEDTRTVSIYVLGRSIMGDLI